VTGIEILIAVAVGIGSHAGMAIWDNYRGKRAIRVEVAELPKNIDGHQVEAEIHEGIFRARVRVLRTLSRGLARGELASARTSTLAELPMAFADQLMDVARRHQLDPWTVEDAELGGHWLCFDKPVSLAHGPDAAISWLRCAVELVQLLELAWSASNATLRDTVLGEHHGTLEQRRAAAYLLAVRAPGYVARMQDSNDARIRLAVAQVVDDLDAAGLMAIVTDGAQPLAHRATALGILARRQERLEASDVKAVRKLVWTGTGRLLAAAVDLLLAHDAIPKLNLLQNRFSVVDTTARFALLTAIESYRGEAVPWAIQAIAGGMYDPVVEERLGTVVAEYGEAADIAAFEAAIKGGGVALEQAAAKLRARFTKTGGLTVSDEDGAGGMSIASDAAGGLSDE